MSNHSIEQLQLQPQLQQIRDCFLQEKKACQVLQRMIQGFSLEAKSVHNSLLDSLRSYETDVSFLQNELIKLVNHWNGGNIKSEVQAVSNAYYNIYNKFIFFQGQRFRHDSGASDQALRINNPPSLDKVITLFIWLLISSIYTNGISLKKYIFWRESLRHKETIWFCLPHKDMYSRLLFEVIFEQSVDYLDIHIQAYVPIGIGNDRAPYEVIVSEVLFPYGSTIISHSKSTNINTQDISTSSTKISEISQEKDELSRWVEEIVHTESHQSIELLKKTHSFIKTQLEEVTHGRETKREYTKGNRVEHRDYIGQKEVASRSIELIQENNFTFKGTERYKEYEVDIIYNAIERTGEFKATKSNVQQQEERFQISDRGVQVSNYSLPFLAPITRLVADGVEQLVNHSVGFNQQQCKELKNLSKQGRESRREQGRETEHINEVLHKYRENDRREIERICGQEKSKTLFAQIELKETEFASETTRDISQTSQAENYEKARQTVLENAIKYSESWEEIRRKKISERDLKSIEDRNSSKVQVEVKKIAGGIDFSKPDDIFKVWQASGASPKHDFVTFFDQIKSLVKLVAEKLNKRNSSELDTLDLDKLCLSIPPLVRILSYEEFLNAQPAPRTIPENWFYQ